MRDSLNGPDRVLVDANKLAADGTIALDWYYPSETGKYVAYGTSPSGSEMSTLHIIETKTGAILPDTIERTRAASVAWKLDNSGFYYTRYPKKGEVPDGQEMYNRHVFYHGRRSYIANGSFSPPSLVFKSLQSEPMPLSRTQGLSFGSYCAPFCAPLLIQRQRNQAACFLVWVTVELR